MEHISNIDDYLKAARKTAVYGHPDYPLLALSEEVGEVMGKIAKYARKNNHTAAEVVAMIGNPANHVDGGDEDLHNLFLAVRKEMGDIAWQWAMLCNELDFMPSEILTENIAKLTDRQERNVINGEGDNR